MAITEDKILRLARITKTALQERIENDFNEIATFSFTTMLRKFKQLNDDIEFYEEVCQIVHDLSPVFNEDDIPF